MINPNQSSSSDSDTKHTEWDELGEVEFSPITVSKTEISKINLSDDPMDEERQDKRVDVADASGMEKRTSNLMLGYNKKGVQVGETYYNVEEFRQKAIESLEEDAKDDVVYYVRKDTGRRFAEPRQVVDDMIVSIVGLGPEVVLSNNTDIINQDARSVEFSGPNGESQRGVFMLGNQGIQMPNGLYAEIGTIDAATNNYAKVTETKVPVAPIPENPQTPSESTPSQSESTPNQSESPIKSPESDISNKDLNQAKIELAELYARNRRLVVGPENRKNFENAKKEYQQLLAERLTQFGRTEYRTEFNSFSSDLQKLTNELAVQNIKDLTDFAGGDLEHPNKTAEEMDAKREELRRNAEAKMKEVYPSMVNNLETTATASMVAEYVKQRSELEDATIDALDNGTICRQAVSKIITNKWVKRGLAAAAAAGLVVTAVGVGRGVINGSMAVSLGYTAGGIAAGALRGGLTGALMSRQSSETSAVKGYGGEDFAKSIDDRFKSGEHLTAESLAAEAMSDYSANNKADANSNKVKTAISAGIGATIGAAASGIHVDNITQSTTTEQAQTGTTTKQVQTGTTTEQVQIGSTTEQVQIGTTTEQVQTGVTAESYDVDLTKIDIKKGSGMGETFADLGGDPSKLSEAIKIANEFDAQYGMVPGSNGVVQGIGGKVGDFAHTYPGTIDTWPQQAREYITQVAQEWAKSGLIDGVKTGGEPVYTAIEKPVYAAIEKPIYATVEKAVYDTIETPVFSTIEKAIVSYMPNMFYNALIQAEAAAISGVIGGALNARHQKTPQKNTPENN